MVQSDSTRLEHEEFISGHDGAPFLDVILTVFPVIPGSLIASSFTIERKQNLFSFCIEYVFCIIPLIMSFTVCSGATFEWNVVLMMFLLVRMLVYHRENLLNERIEIPQPFQKGNRLTCLTSFRATVNLATIIAILAVDFHIFPRRFAKTETYGYSLMDVGAACYLLMNGITDYKKPHLTRQLFRDTLVMLGLGFLRLVFVKALNYQQHVTEYGVHCNFFFTLAFIKLICLHWTPRLTLNERMFLCLLLAVGHEAGLQFGLGDWTLGDVPRSEGILEANREWLVSLPGNTLIYLLGMNIGHIIFVHNRDERKFSWAGMPMVVFIVLFLFDLAKYEPSRRLANVAFVLWIAGFSLLFLTAFKIMETVFAQKGCQMFQAINAYALPFFLVGNLLTGFVNLSVNTLEVSSGQAFAIISGYAFILCYMVHFLNSRKETR